MGIILDTDVVINAERQSFDLSGWMRSNAGQTFELAAITVAVLWHGLERASGVHKLKRRIYLEAILSALPVVPYTNRTAFGHAHIWAELESSGKMIGLHDLIVAATALEHGHAVATFNQRHFSQIKGLTVIDPLIPGR